MKVLLIGHLGFVGQNLLKILLNKKINLFIIKHNNLKISNFRKIKIIDLKKKSLNKSKNFNLIIHAAWGNLQNYYSKNM